MVSFVVVCGLSNTQPFLCRALVGLKFSAWVRIDHQLIAEQWSTSIGIAVTVLNDCVSEASRPRP